MPNGRYLKNLILQKVVKQKKIIKSNALIIHFYVQCVPMTMNNISTSGGLRKDIFAILNHSRI